MTAPVRLVVGLGNPGPRYTATRHNAGFWFVEQLAAQQALTLRSESKFHGQLGRLAASDCWLLKPDIFMNRSGLAVAAVAFFYQIPPAHILVVHDDLDLPPGSARLKQDGGHGGHNGLRDIIQSLGSADFLRLRLGIGHPGHKNSVVDYVLDKPLATEQEEINAAIDAALTHMPLLWRGELSQAMNSLHRNQK